ncbi:MAG: UDP-N-acetylglucosamine 1-carboxyvinyltransferase [Patescibacteria group bacterium]
MSKYIITGQKPLQGTVNIGGAKNASYKIMIASLLGSTQSSILNFSKISDVELVAEIIAYLGAGVKKNGDRTYSIDPSTLNNFQIKLEDGAQGRFSTIFIPVLLAKFGRASVPAPGGDKIGKRPLDRHLDGLKALGAGVTIEDGLYQVSANKLIGTTYRFAKNTHTGTETMILAGAMAQGATVLENSALEPEVDDLIKFLNAMGAKIERQPNRVIKIEGVNQLGGAIHQLMPDRNEAVSYACAALATKGDVIIQNARPQDLTAFLEKLSEAGGEYQVGEFGIRFFYTRPLQATWVTTQVAPGFMTDWQPLWATLMTQAQGISQIHETIMTSRFQYVDELKQMGANIETFQPQIDNPEQVYNFDLTDDLPTNHHAIRITGATPLIAGHFKVKDLRHGATLVLAAMTASGTSTIDNVEMIDRGYEDLANRLNSMGADIRLQR